ncbi:hypothetical protein Sulku_1609 [Sulfuricurvum kujiense DSM 16994]|uniref:Uncharacterized protein n=1 Tax=Sulfuricurvum kujiense (strain ATCC BAA-921 / DSM 16994 / JCM 11577 / YK-1) TaxID=709032 RepID=E4U084_SULKY|nr:hypothetical protein [Sulfuricurvum kujiense]ADR34270.1 hypothetical protein Sulku_1609 [Sulfuricurvum kujiense DSM 16994]
MELLNKVMKYLTMFQSKNAPESQNFAGEIAVASSSDRVQGAKVAAIAAALHHHEQESNDVRAKVAAIAAALHHHELENSQNGGLLGIAALAAVIHHHNNLKK